MLVTSTRAAGRVVADSTDLLLRAWSFARGSCLRTPHSANGQAPCNVSSRGLRRHSRACACLQHAGSRRGYIAEGRVFINNVGCQSPKFLFTRITPPDAGGLAPNAEVESHGTGTPRFPALAASPSRTTW